MGQRIGFYSSVTGKPLGETLVEWYQEAGKWLLLQEEEAQRMDDENLISLFLRDFMINTEQLTQLSLRK